MKRTLLAVGVAAGCFPDPKTEQAAAVGMRAARHATMAAISRDGQVRAFRAVTSRL